MDTVEVTPKTAGPKYPIAAHTRFSPIEFQRVQEAAKAAGLSVCAYIRARTLGEKIKPKMDRRAKALAVGQLAQVGGLIKHLFNEGVAGDLVPLTLVDEVSAAIRRVSSNTAPPTNALAELDAVGKKVVTAHKLGMLSEPLVARWREAIRRVGA